MVRCSNCNKETKFKYKPPSGSGLQGFLCADCHIEKTKEVTTLQKKNRNEPTNEEIQSCHMCHKTLQDDEIMKPKWRWNIESGSVLCNDCFIRKDADFDKKLNFCALCNRKLGYIRYNPKQKWKIEGQLCRYCWDIKNKG